MPAAWLGMLSTDRAAYERNAADPAQHQRYLAFRRLLSEDPSWADGTWHSFAPDTA